jgi:hypothetical protein
MTIRASEPPMNERRLEKWGVTNTADFILLLRAYNLRLGIITLYGVK